MNNEENRPFEEMLNLTFKDLRNLDKDKDFVKMKNVYSKDMKPSNKSSVEINKTRYGCNENYN